jgi:hypothetical protein
MAVVTTAPALPAAPETIAAQLAATTAADHAGTIPLILAGIALLLAAGIVRRLIKLALLVAVAGLIALVLAAWRAGLLS